MVGEGRCGEQMKARLWRKIVKQGLVVPGLSLAEWRQQVKLNHSYLTTAHRLLLARHSEGRILFGEDPSMGDISLDYLAKILMASGIIWKAKGKQWRIKGDQL